MSNLISAFAKTLYRLPHFALWGQKDVVCAQLKTGKITPKQTVPRWGKRRVEQKTYQNVAETTRFLETEIRKNLPMLLEALTPEDPSNFSWKFRNVTLYEDPQTLIYESKGKGHVMTLLVNVFHEEYWSPPTMKMKVGNRELDKFCNTALFLNGAEAQVPIETQVTSYVFDIIYNPARSKSNENEKMPVKLWENDEEKIKIGLKKLHSRGFTKIGLVVPEEDKLILDLILKYSKNAHVTKLHRITSLGWCYPEVTKIFFGLETYLFSLNFRSENTDIHPDEDYVSNSVPEAEPEFDHTHEEFLSLYEFCRLGPFHSLLPFALIFSRTNTHKTIHDYEDIEKTYDSDESFLAIAPKYKLGEYIFLATNQAFIEAELNDVEDDFHLLDDEPMTEEFFSCNVVLAELKDLSTAE